MQFSDDGFEQITAFEQFVVLDYLFRVGKNLTEKCLVRDSVVMLSLAYYRDYENDDPSHDDQTTKACFHRKG